jgi:hypothetical protein
MDRAPDAEESLVGG